MLTDCAEDASIAKCEYANASAQVHVWMHYEISVLYGFSFFLIILQALVTTISFIYEFDQGGETAKKLHTKLKLRCHN